MIVLITISTPAIAVTIDFEDLPYNQCQAGNVTPNPESVITDNFKTYGVVFGSNESAGIAVSRDSLAPSSGLNSVVGLDINGQIPGTSQGAALGDIFFSFVVPGTRLPADTNYVSFTVGDTGGDVDIFDIRSYDIADVLIDVKHIESKIRCEVTISLPNIHRVEINFTGNYGYSLDDLIFSYPAATTPPPLVPFDPNESNSLFIQNFVKQFQADPNYPHENQGLLTYVEKAGNLNDIDPNDIFYNVPGTIFSKIVSIIANKNSKGEITGYDRLSKDVRPSLAQLNDLNNDTLIELSIYNPKSNNPKIDSENYLNFWLAGVNSFKGQPLTIQQLSTDPDIEYPVWDIRNIISKNRIKLPLDYIVTDLKQMPDDPNSPVRIIEINVPYAWFILSTSRQVPDINDDGITDFNDFILLYDDLDQEGILRSDIASLKNGKSVLGIPDGKVDETDIDAFIEVYNKKYPEEPIIISEGFESGQIQFPFVTIGSSTWIIDSKSHNGKFSVKSGDICDNQNSIVQVTAKCAAGQISFYRKVSSEGYDVLIFYIDDVEKGRWSGLLDWGKISYQTTPGTHILKWEYKKDWVTSDGQDAAWIDDIAIQ